MEYVTLLVAMSGALLCYSELQLMFGLKDGENHEVIYEGEDVSMICQSSENGFALLIYYNSMLIINDGTVQSDWKRTIVNVTKASNQLEFTLQSVRMKDAGFYRCLTILSSSLTPTVQFTLIVHQHNSVQCRQNNTSMFISMEGLELSCYFTVSNSVGYMWVKSVNGLSSAIPSKLVTGGNGIKKELVATVLPSDDLTPATYSCQSSVQSAESCTTDSYVIYNKPFFAFTPSITTLVPGDTVRISCKSVIMPESPIFWIVGDMSAGVTVQTPDSGVLNITVAPNATSASYANAKCSTFILGSFLAHDLHITVDNISKSSFLDAYFSTGTTGMPVSTQKLNSMETTNMDSNGQSVEEGNNSNSLTITIIVVGSLAVVILIGVLVVVLFTAEICSSLTTKKREKDPRNVYSHVDKYRSSQSDAEKNGKDDLRSDQRDVTDRAQTRPVVVGNSLATGREDQDFGHLYGKVNKNRGSRPDLSKNDEDYSGKGEIPGDVQPLPGAQSYENHDGDSANNHRYVIDDGRVPPTTGYGSRSYEVEMGYYNGGGDGSSVRNGSVMNGGYYDGEDQDYNGQPNELFRPVSVLYSEVNKDTDCY